MIYLVRHGAASAKYGSEADPGLGSEGLRQAEALAENWSLGGPYPIYSSPMCRAQETAAPLARAWAQTPVISNAVREIPAPSGTPLEGRPAWIEQIMKQAWHELGDEQQEWKAGIMDFLQKLDGDAVIFTHLMVINAVVAHLEGKPEVIQFRPDYTSITEIENSRGALRLHSLGRQKRGQVL